MRQLKITKQITDRNDDALCLYLQEISKIKLLTTEEEVELARRIDVGDRRALEELIKGNLRFVVSVANQYKNKGLSLSDLINEGNLGLIYAAERFDITRGFKFITYAVWWIRQSITQAIELQSRTVRLPLNKIVLRNKIKKAFNQLSHKFLRDPTISELSDFLDLKYEIVEEAINVLNIHVSMDAPFGDEKENNLCNSILNENSPNPEAGLIRESLKNDIERSFTNLSSRDAEILRHFYGLNGYEAQSFENIGNEFGLSAERVRQIKEQSIEKLKIRQHSNQLLKEYISS
jgi:RNA polymerase primary sigma factor